MDFDPDAELSQLREMNRAELLADLTEEATNIVFLLQVQAEADAESRHMTLIPAEGTVVLPPTVRANIGPESKFDYLTVEYERSSTSEAASLTVQLFFYSANETELLINLVKPANGSQPDAYYAELIVDDDQHYDEYPVPLPDIVPAEEVSRLLMSICIPNKSGDYSAFDALDHNDPYILRNISDALSKQAIESSEQGRFNLRPYGFEGYLSYIKDDGHLNSVEIGAITENGAARASIQIPASNEDNYEPGPVLRPSVIEKSDASIPLQFTSLTEEHRYLSNLRAVLQTIQSSLVRPEESPQNMDERSSDDFSD